MHETVRTNEFFEIWLIYLTPTPNHQQGEEHRGKELFHPLTQTRRGRESILGAGVVADVDIWQGILKIGKYGLGNASRWNPLAYVDCRECVAFNFAHCA